jgi:hypothetical protein
MGAMFITLLMMALAGGYALLRGHVAITDRLILRGWQARLLGGLWLLPLVSLLILWSLPGYEPTTVTYWPLILIAVVVIATVVIVNKPRR